MYTKLSYRRRLDYYYRKWIRDNGITFVYANADEQTVGSKLYFIRYIYPFILSNL